jgi:hypothetical protein
VPPLTPIVEEYLFPTYPVEAGQVTVRHEALKPKRFHVTPASSDFPCRALC